MTCPRNPTINASTLFTIVFPCLHYLVLHLDWFHRPLILHWYYLFSAEKEKNQTNLIKLVNCSQLRSYNEMIYKAIHNVKLLQDVLKTQVSKLSILMKYDTTIWKEEQEDIPCQLNLELP